MYLSLIKFEFLQQLYRPRFYMGALILLGFVIGLASNQYIHNKLGYIDIPYNSPFVITTWSYAFSAISIFLFAAFASGLIRQDYQFKIIDLITTTGISKLHYLGSRYLAGLLSCAFLVSLIPIGLYIAVNLPIISESQLNQFNLSTYTQSLFIVILPNLIISFSILFGVASLSQSNKWVFITAIFLFILSDGISEIADSSQNHIAIYFDPQGAVGFWSTINSWSLQQKNSTMFNFDTVWLLSRIIWFGLAGLCLFIGYRQYPFAQLKELKPVKTKKSKTSQKAMAPIIQNHQNLVHNLSPDNWQSRIFQITEIALFELYQLWAKTTTKIVLGICLVLTLIPVLESIDQPSMTNSVITSEYLATHIIKILHWPLLILIIIYGAEIVGKERESNVRELAFSLLTYRPALLIGKLLALWLIIILFKCSVILAAAIAEAFISNNEVAFGNYFYSVLVEDTPYFLLFTMLVFSVQILTQSNYLAMLVSFSILLVSVSLPKIGLDGHLYRFVLPDQADNLILSVSELNHLKYSLLLYWCVLIGILFYFTLQIWKEPVTFQPMNYLANLLSLSHMRTKLIIASALITIFILGNHIQHFNH